MKEVLCFICIMSLEFSVGLRLLSNSNLDDKYDGHNCTKGRYYVYDDLPQVWDDADPEVKAPVSMKDLHYDNLMGDAFLSEQSFGESIYLRLLHSECRTRDAGEADVFFIPILLGRKKNDAWRKACKGAAAKFTDLKKHMKYLNKKTARQHLVVHNHGHALQGCYGWWQTPLDESFKHVSRFTTDNRTEQAKYIHLTSPIPYATSLHAHKGMAKPPWKHDFPRPNLIAYSTNTKVHGVTADVRKYLISACEKNKECRFINTQAHPDFNELYSSAEFCLQPAGDTFARKGIVQSLLMGCIPVLFHHQQVGLWDWFWGSWKHDSSVFIDGSHLQKQHTSALVDALKKIPFERRQEMRRTIAANAYKMQWAVQETPDGEDDAFDIMVQHLKKGEDGYHAGLAEDQVVKEFLQTSHSFTEGESKVLLRTPTILEL